MSCSEREWEVASGRASKQAGSTSWPAVTSSTMSCSPLLSFKKLKWKRMPWLAFSYIHSVDPFSNCFILLFSWLLSVLGTGGKSIVRVRMQREAASSVCCCAVLGRDPQPSKLPSLQQLILSDHSHYYPLFWDYFVFEFFFLVFSDMFPQNSWSFLNTDTIHFNAWITDR